MDPKTAPNPISPNIHIFEDIKSSNFKNLFSEWIMSYKIIYVLLVLVIVVELGLGLKTLLTPLPQAGQVQSVSDGQVILSSEKTGYKIDEEILVDIKLSTGGHTTVGTDLVLKFDPNFLEVSGDDFFESGKAYTDYPGVSVDNENSQIILSGIVLNDQAGFNGVSNFGTVMFKAKKTGRTRVSVEFTKGLTVDSNIIETVSAKDILGEVYNLDLNIGSEGVSTIPDTKNACSGFVQLCFDEEGNQGTQKCTGGKKRNEACLKDPYLTEECEICQTGK